MTEMTTEQLEEELAEVRAAIRKWRQGGGVTNYSRGDRSASIGISELRAQEKELMRRLRRKTHGAVRRVVPLS